MSLLLRVKALAQAIGTDIKDINLKLDAFEGGSIATTPVTIPGLGPAPVDSIDFGVNRPAVISPDGKSGVSVADGTVTLFNNNTSAYGRGDRAAFGVTPGLISISVNNSNNGRVTAINVGSDSVEIFTGEGLKTKVTIAEAVTVVGADIVSSTDDGDASLQGLSAAVSDHIGATGEAHGLATPTRAGFMSPDQAKFLEFFGGINNIGTQGGVGFGVGICPKLPPGMSDMTGTMIKGHDNYGNYQYQDGSVMGWVPAFLYRYGHISNKTYATYGVNSVSVLPRHAYPTLLAAAIAGYALHRAFWDDGVEQPGVFVDKYKCSNNDGIASSIKNGNPLSSSAAHNPFSALNGSPPNNYSGAITAVKTRGEDFFAATPFIQGMLALLSLAHGQAATSAAACAWHDSTGVSNFPKGCNNNALGDANDPAVKYISDGYSNAAKTGSGTPFEKTTHNGQACGIADINGGMWEIQPGLTFFDGNYYILSPDARAADLTPGFTLDTDAWGSAGLAATHHLLGPSFGTLGTGVSNRAIGSASQVLSEATEGLEWAAAGAGIPLVDGTGGSNLFGNDRFYDNKPQHMCTFACGSWSSGVTAGAWARVCSHSRAGSNDHVGVRAALYLVKRSDSE